MCDVCQYGEKVKDCLDFDMVWSIYISCAYNEARELPPTKVGGF